MSETDDTDDLLLIPPDFFVNQIEFTEIQTIEPYMTIMDSLINQVDQLEGRLSCLENADYSYEKKYASTDDILQTTGGSYMNSTYSTPQKPRHKYKLPSHTPKSKHKRSPPNGRRKMLTDIDRYIDTTKHSLACCELDFSAANSEIGKSEINDVIEVSGRVINLKDIEEMLHAIEVKRKPSESKPKSLPINTSNAWNLEKPYLDTKVASVETIDSSGCCGDKSTTSSSENTQSTTRKLPAAKLTVEAVSSDTLNKGDTSHKVKSLLSLRDLWSSTSGVSSTSLKEQFEEERLRRRHCEEVIQKLQQNKLELQEKIAVALRVDQAKDQAICKFHDAWEQLVKRMEETMKECEELEKNLKDIQDQREADKVSAMRKIHSYQEGSAKAIEVAQAASARLTELENENVALTTRLNDVENKFSDLQVLYNLEESKIGKLQEVVSTRDAEILEHKQLLTDSRNEIMHSKKAVEMCESEFLGMKNKYIELEQLLTEKQKVIVELESQKSRFAEEREYQRRTQEKLENEVSELKSLFEKQKIELRDFYQEQVEIVVRNKLYEFQKQLDKAESSLQEEIRNREANIAKLAAGHIQQINEKHHLEINLLEEKHCEEMKLYKCKLSHSHQQLDKLQQRIKEINDRRTVLAKQLHRVMEVQWQEALKIINSSKSPSNDITIDQLSMLKTQSRSNLDEVLSEKTDEGENVLDTSSHIDCCCEEIVDTPLSSRAHNGHKQLLENDLQKYVQLLLNKQSSSTVNSNSTQETAIPTSLSNDRFLYCTDLTCDSKDKSNQMRKGAKPPWK